MVAWHVLQQRRGSCHGPGNNTVELRRRYGDLLAAERSGAGAEPRGCQLRGGTDAPGAAR